ncbi:MAG: SPOR domain-containing protein [Xylanivirga thermophila]|uniref:SPOR domain-containing protein n=1 Tax=Xylanivirga thermophila TaxID=2496273 RepID=UPI0039F56268
MRYSRIKRRKRKKGYAIFIVIIIVCAGFYIYGAGAAGNFLSKLISPIIENRDGHKGIDVKKEKEQSLVVDPHIDDESKKDGPANSEEREEKMEQKTEQIEVQPLTVSAIQIGAFSSRENAEMWAKDLRERGGAGYIIEDKYFRLMGVCFMSEADAQKVKMQLKEQNVESEIYFISYPGAKIEITASADKVDILKSAFSTWQPKLTELEDIIKQLDSDKLGSESAYSKIKAMKNGMTEKMEALDSYISMQPDNDILAGLANVYKESLKSFDDVLSEKPENKLAISAKIKYTYIDMVYRFKGYMQGITK